MTKKANDSKNLWQQGLENIHDPFSSFIKNLWQQGLENIHDPFSSFIRAQTTACLIGKFK